MTPATRLCSLLLGGVVLALAGCETDSIPASDADQIVFQDGTDAELLLAEDLSYQSLFAENDGPVLGKGIDALRTLKVTVDEVGMAHTKVQQLHRGVPVWEGQAIVHLAQNGKFSYMTDDLLPNVAVDTTPDYTADEAIDLAVEEIPDGWEGLDRDPVAELWVLRHKGVDHLVYRVQTWRLDGTADDAMPVFFIDAHSGEVVWSYNNLQTATCTGATNFYGTVNVDCNLYGSTYYLEDTTDLLGTYSYRTGTSTIYDVSTTTGTFDTSTSYTKNALEAHYAVQATYNYYKSTFGRNGINGSGGPTYKTSHGYSYITSVASYSRSYVNAYWDSTKMVYGDGDGSNSGSLTTLDIAGHELTHGVTEYEANLTYSGESGGLNESMSDVFGAMVERSVLGDSTDVWLVGEDTWTPGISGDALRYMNDPFDDGYSMDYYSSAAASTDVHYNSGISNLAFYLLSEGGTHPRSKSTTVVTAIGEDAAAAIWYHALANNMTSSTNFAGARTATLASASYLYGSTSTQYTQVGNAWTAVGVGTSGGGSTSSCTTASYTGSLSRSGKSGYAPSSSGTSVTATSQTVSLTGPSSADFDIYLQKKSGSSWSTVASSTGSTSTESISYSGTSGTYRVQVYSYSGSGSYAVSWCK